ncbi:MAG: hypothetical protein ACOC2H_04990 [Spirochaetota bacterium]
MNAEKTYDSYLDSSRQEADAYMHILLEDVCSAVKEKQAYLSDDMLLAYIHSRLSHVRDITSHYFFIDFRMMIDSLLRRIDAYTGAGARSASLISFILDELSSQVPESPGVQNASADETFTFILFIRNSIRFVSPCRLYIVLSPDGNLPQDVIPRIHPATAGEKGRYVLYPEENSPVVCIADALEYRLTSRLPRYIDASICSTGRRLQDIKGYFRYKGRRYYVPDMERRR